MLKHYNFRPESWRQVYILVSGGLEQPLSTKSLVYWAPSL